MHHLSALKIMIRGCALLVTLMLWGVSPLEAAPQATDRPAPSIDQLEAEIQKLSAKFNEISYKLERMNDSNAAQFREFEWKAVFAERTLYVIAALMAMIQVLMIVMDRKIAENITLVNDIIRIGRDTARTAASSVEKNVRTQLETLDHETARFLSNFANRDDRTIISRQGNRDKTLRLIKKFNRTSDSNSILVKPLPISPQCKFIESMGLYLEQDFEGAIEILTGISVTSEADLDLRIRSLYWIGYECNNLGQFDKAETTFERAIQLAAGGRQIELRRMLLETRLFNSEKYKAKELSSKAEQLVRDADYLLAKQEISQETVDMSRITHSNILYVCALNEMKINHEAEAKNYLHNALNPLKSIRTENFLSERDYVFICIALGINSEECQETLRKRIRPSAEQEFLNRIEPRSKVTSSAVSLVCCKEVSSLSDHVPSTLARTTSMLNSVHDKVYVYSPIQKRNVMRSELFEELEAIVKQGLPRL